jgi:hypothetical protein
MLEMSNGNLLFLASASTISSFNGTIPDFTLLMLDGSGNRLWQKDYYGYPGGGLAEGDNGDILSFANGRFTRFDANGNVQAQRTAKTGSWCQTRLHPTMTGETT